MDQPGGVGSEAAPAGLRHPMKSATTGHAVRMSTPCTPNPVSANAYTVDDSAGPGVWCLKRGTAQDQLSTGEADEEAAHDGPGEPGRLSLPPTCLIGDAVRR